MKFTSELRDATCQWDHTIYSHSVICHPTEVTAPPSRPRKDERLSWPSWLVTYRNDRSHSPSIVTMAISRIVCELGGSDLLVENRDFFIPRMYLAPRRGVTPSEIREDV